MKYLKIIGIFFLFAMGASCKNEDDLIVGKYEFKTEYSATITVGGFVGITERTFAMGEVYEGTDYGGETITIRIAEHSELNQNCPNSWCYQEYLDVPQEFLKLVQ